MAGARGARDEPARAQLPARHRHQPGRPGRRVRHGVRGHGQGQERRPHQRRAVRQGPARRRDRDDGQPADGRARFRDHRRRHRGRRGADVQPHRAALHLEGRGPRPPHPGRGRGAADDEPARAQGDQGPGRRRVGLSPAPRPQPAREHGGRRQGAQGPRDREPALRGHVAGGGGQSGAHGLARGVHGPAAGRSTPWTPIPSGCEMPSCTRWPRTRRRHQPHLHDDRAHDEPRQVEGAAPGPAGGRDGGGEGRPGRQPREGDAGQRGCHRGDEAERDEGHPARPGAVPPRPRIRSRALQGPGRAGSHPALQSGS